MTSERVYRWEPALIAALVLAGVGVFVGNVVAILGAVIPLSYVLFGSVNSLPQDSSIEVERELSKPTPSPGSLVTVTLRVRNTDSAVYSDLRIVDAVPDDLSVVDGSPRAAFSLRPGATRELEYTVIARRGTFEFASPSIRIRTLTGTQRATVVSAVDGDTAIDCLAQPEDVPLQAANTIRAGAIASDASGEGIDFHSLREYRSSDRISRVDWRHYAKTSELTTVEFQEQRSATTLLVVDARASANATPFAGHPGGIELVTYAAAQVSEALVNAGHRVGVTVMGVDGDDIDPTVETDSTGAPWVEPEAQAETAIRIQHILNAVYLHWTSDGTRAESTTTKPSDQPASTDGGTTIANRITSRTDTATQVLLVSPLLDEELLPIVKQLRVSGHGVSCISPNLTVGPGNGATVASLARHGRLDALRGTGTAIIDWEPDKPLWPVLEQNFTSLV